MKYAFTRSPKDLNNFPIRESNRHGFLFRVWSLHTPRNKTNRTGNAFSTRELYNTKFDDFSYEEFNH